MSSIVRWCETVVSIATGLSEKQIEESRRLFGRNELTPPPKTPWFKELLGKFKDPTIVILVAAAMISLLITGVEKWGLGNAEASFVDSIGIVFAVLLATLVGFFSERKSAREFELLNKVKDDITIKVVRDGQVSTVQIGDLVVGDLVCLDRGDKIPADGVLLESKGLYVDQAMLTGESVPVRKIDYPQEIELESSRGTISPGDASFLARGTMVADGRGTLLILAVGDETQMGKIAGALAQTDDEKSETPLTAKLSRLAKQISVVGVVGAIAIFTAMGVMTVVDSVLLTKLATNSVAFLALSVASIVAGILATRFGLKPFFAGMDMKMTSRRLFALSAVPMAIGAFTVFLGVWGILLPGSSLDETGVDLLKEILLAFVVAVTIIVVAVPEGLPMMVTVSLALNMMKMARENCLVRKLVASETIGSATVICTDKTGTLTQNQMKPVWAFVGQKEYESSSFDSLIRGKEWRSIVQGIAINSSADLHIETDAATNRETVEGVGNPTECSLLKFLRQFGVDYLKERGRSTKIYEVAHNSDRKMSATTIEENGENVCFVKGAPERVLSRCSTVLVDGEIRPIAEYQPAIDAAIRQASDRALRVLAFSEKRLGKERCDACRDNNAELCLQCESRTFVGLIGIADPIREEVPAAVQTCLDAGVQVKMITGDALPTAVAIARQAKIYQGRPDEIVLTSEEFNQISDDELPGVAKKIKVLARSTPMDKLRLVKALHREGEVVAMTGDGTNDAPALKFADVGLSMGVTGTEVAKEASDIVLVDDNFKSIVTGVWWGRTLFQNIQRFLQFQLSVNVVALLCALIGPMVGVPLPLTVTQLLWINIIMDTFAAIALSTEPPRLRTMKEQPIPRNAHIITGTMGVSILTVGLYQVAILFAALFGGWFMTDPDHVYDFSVSPTSNDYLDHNLQALTVFFTILVMFQFWHKINCRALRHDESPFALITKNRLFLIIIGTITIVQIAMVQTEFIGRFFRTTPLYFSQWLEIGILTATVIPVAWLGRKLSFWLGVDR